MSTGGPSVVIITGDREHDLCVRHCYSDCEGGGGGVSGEGKRVDGTNYTLGACFPLSPRLVED